VYRDKKNIEYEIFKWRGLKVRRMDVTNIFILLNVFVKRHVKVHENALSCSNILLLNSAYQGTCIFQL